MSDLTGKSMTDVDSIWVVSKANDPIEAIIFGGPYLIGVETDTLGNITYILDPPVFRAQTKADPCPARTDDLSSTVFY